jgi:hypothetical protein
MNSITKFNKIVFSSSEELSVFWNLQARIWNTVFGVQPILLLWGKKSKTTVSETYGKVIECEFNNNFPKVLQITLSKFHYPATDQQSVWMVGDIDLLPLQKKYYCDLDDVSFDERTYYHIAGSTERGIDPLRDPWTVGEKGYGNKRLYGHSHIAKGSLFTNLFFHGRKFYDVMDFIVRSDIYGNRSHHFHRMHEYHWCAEEDYTTHSLNNHSLAGHIKVHTKTPEDHGLRIERNRYLWDKDPNFSGYQYDAEMLKSGGYVDIHCQRPFSDQERSLMDVLSCAGMISC